MQVLMQSSLQNHEETVNNLLQKNNKERQLQLDLAIAEQVPLPHHQQSRTSYPHCYFENTVCRSIFLFTNLSCLHHLMPDLLLLLKQCKLSFFSQIILLYFEQGNVCMSRACLAHLSLKTIVYRKHCHKLLLVLANQS